MNIEGGDEIIKKSSVSINTKKKPQKRKNTSVLPPQKRLNVQEVLDGDRVYLFNRSDAFPKDEVALQNKFNAKRETNYICNFCEKTYFNHKKLKLHMLLNHNVKFCEICDLFLLDEEDLRRHNDKVHADCTCQICRQSVVEDLEEHYMEKHDAKVCKYCHQVMRPSSHFETHLQEKHGVKNNSLAWMHEEDIIGMSNGSSFHCGLCGSARSKQFFGHFCFYHKINIYVLADILKRLGIEIKQLNTIKTDLTEIIEGNDKFCNLCPKTVPKSFHKVFCENYLPCRHCFEIFESAELLADHEPESCASRDEGKCGLCEENLTENHLLIKHKANGFEGKLINFKSNSAFCALCDELLNDSELYKHFEVYHSIDEGCILVNIGSRNMDDDSDESNSNSVENEEKLLIFNNHDYKSDFNPKFVMFCFDERSVDAENSVFCDYCAEECDDNAHFLEHLREKHNFQIGCYTAQCEQCRTSGNHSMLKQHLNSYEEFRAQPYECEICSESIFAVNTRLHILEKHSDSLGDLDLKRFGVKCRFCEEMFWETELKEKHELLEHLDCNKEDFLECSKCENSFCSLDSLRNHDNCESYTDIAYQCTICHVVFASISKVRGHFNDVHPKMLAVFCPFPDCGRNFGALIYAKKHMRETHKKTKKKVNTLSESTVVCSVCGRKFATTKSLKLHAHSHERGFKCVICAKKFDTVESRKFHYNKEHSGESLYECHICQKPYRSKAALFGHRKVHKEHSKVVCKICNKEFTIDYMKEHMLIHNGPMLQCPHCPKTFTAKSNLRRHIRQHTGEKPYTCPYCPKTFSDKGACNMHSNIHTGKLSCYCEICGKKFSTRQKLVNHMKRHTGEGLLKCEVCAKEYTCSTELRKHISLQHKELQDHSTQIICYCGRFFTSERFLKLHMSKAHDPAKQVNNTKEPKKIKCFQCLLCQNYYSLKSMIHNHLKAIHQLEKDEYSKNMRQLNAAEAVVLQAETPDVFEQDTKKEEIPKVEEEIPDTKRLDRRKLKTPSKHKIETSNPVL